MKLSIDSALKKKCPLVALALVAAQVCTGDSSLELLAEMEACETSILKNADARMLLDAPAISATRTGYRALGKDPARYRGSAESRLPIGLYDLAHVEGDIVFRAGRKGETYKGIGKFDLNLEDLPVFADAAGPHGSPTSDSERTMVTPSTERVAAILISFGGPQPLDAWCRRMATLLERYAEGQELRTELVE